MPTRRPPSLVAFAAFALIISQHLPAVPPTDSNPVVSHRGQGTTGVNRQAAGPDSVSKHLPLLGQYSGIAESALEELLSSSLPPAITKAVVEKDVRDLAKESAKFASYLNRGQIDEMAKDSAAKLMELSTKEPSERDSRQLSLLQSLNWVARVKQGETPTSPQEEAFAEIAKQEISLLETQQEEFWNKVDLAINTGDRTAKRELREKVNRSALLTYLQTQLDSPDAEDRERAQKLALALAETETTKTGEKRGFLDTNGKTNDSNQRVWIASKSEGTAQLFKQMRQAKHLDGQHLALAAHAGAPAKERNFHLGPDGKLATGSPAGIEIVKRITLPRTPVNQPVKLVKKGTPKTLPNDAALRKFIGANCNTACHGTKVGGSGASLKIGHEDKSLLSLGRALAVVKDGEMLASPAALAEFSRLISELEIN